MSEKTWRYTDASGALREVGTEELRQALRTAAIPSSTMVWHTGMTEWAPAFTIPELSLAAIAAARTPTIPPVPNEQMRRRGPMKTLVGVDAPELLRQASLQEQQLARAAENANRPKSIPPPLPPEARSRSTRPGPPRVPSTPAEGELGREFDMVASIPKAPGVPKEAAAIRDSSTTEVRETPRHESTPPPRDDLGGATFNTIPNASRTMPSAGTTQISGTPRSSPPPLPEAKRQPPKRLPTPLPFAAKSPPSLRRPGAATLLGLPKAAQAAVSGGRSKPPPPPLRGRTTQTMPAVEEPKPAQRKPAPPLKDRTPRPPEVTQVLADAPKAEPKPEAPAKAEVKEIRIDGAKAETPKPEATANKTDTPKAGTPLSLQTKTTELEAVKEPTAAAHTNGAATPDEAKAVAALRKQNRTLELEAPESIKTEPRPPSVVEAERKLSEEQTEPIGKTLLDAKTLLAQSRTEETNDTITVTVRSDRAVASIETSSRRPDPGKSKSKAKAKPVESSGAPETASIALARPLESARVERAIEIPRRSLIAASFIWMLGLVGFFFVGRVTGFRAASVEVLQSGVVGAFVTPPVDKGGTSTAAAEPKPCWVVRQPVKWANEAYKSVPFDMHAGADGKMAVGFAASEKDAVGISVDPKSGKFDEKYREKGDDVIARVSPWTSAEKGFIVSKKSEKVAVSVDVSPPFVVFFDKTQISVADSLDGAATPAFDLAGDGATAAEQVIEAGAGGYFVTLRQGASVFGGYLTKERTKASGLSAVSGAGGKGGKPKSGFNGQEVAVTFAEKPEGPGNYELRVGRAATGTVPETTVAVAIPDGGPGGDAIAPDIVGLSGGRWLLMWTEGSEGTRAIRAQTYSSAFEAIGDPIALSPPAGDFGQAVLGTVGSYTLVVFLQRGAEAFELWGAVLRCE